MDDLSIGRNRLWSGPSPIFTANFLAFIIASAGAFLPRNTMLLIGVDGEYARDIIIQVSRFADSILSLPLMPFQGMGSLLPYNLLLAPSMLPVLLGDAVGKWLGFLICAALVFLSTYALGRALGMRQGVALFAAWLLPPLCLPYQAWLNLYLRYSLEPSNADFISVAILLVALLASGYKSSRALWPALGIILAVIWLFLADPLYIVLLIPTALVVSVGIVASHTHEPGFVRRTALFALPSIAFLALGAGAYLLGLYSDTAASFFPHEMNASFAHTWRMATVATAWNKGIDPIGGLWVGLALLGIVLAIWREKATLRAVALAVLAALIFLAAYIAVYFMSFSWWLPYPIYFEQVLWPFYVLFATYAVAALARYAADVLRHRTPFIAKRMLSFPQTTGQLFGRSLAIGAVLGVAFALHPFAVMSDLYKPPVDTAITRALQAASAIAPNTGFRGYTANLTGLGGVSGAPTDWFGIMTSLNEAILSFGNAHRLPYLWRYSIPTIESYSQTVEPAIYAVISRLLDRPGDRQVRNITMITKTNFLLMQSLGVRFLITDYQLPEPARSVAHLVKPGITHFLYELPDPNYGGYSPTEIIVAQNATDTLRRLADPDLDFRKTIVLNEPLDLALVPAEDSDFIVVRGGWRVKARSRGRSLLLLPLQFSACLSAIESPQDGGKVIAVRRANLASTALIFEGTIDVRLSGHVSPFWNAYCRLRDARDLRTLGVADLPKRLSPAL
jgi:hypothetical protein